MEIKNENTALLVMDIQPATIAMLKDSESYLSTLNLAIKKARADKVQVIYVVIGFRAGYPEINPNSKMFERFKNNPAFKLDTLEAMQVHPAIAQEKEDITVIKKRVSAFTGSDLEVILRAKGIKHLVFTGIATSGVVLSTLREASDKDYLITVLSDGCADGDEEVHRVLTTKIFPRQADVMTVAEWRNLKD